MKILFVHQNFPGQFKYLAPQLVREGHKVHALHMRKGLKAEWNGVSLHHHFPSRSSSKEIHPWLRGFETKVIRSESALQAYHKMKKQGFNPDIIIGHPGWGECQLLKEVWPLAKVGLYAEFYYNQHDSDIDFDPEFSERRDPDKAREKAAIFYNNLNAEISFENADAGLSPTFWQANTFPPPIRQKISVIHEGVNTRVLHPSAERRKQSRESLKIPEAAKVVTYVSRNLEPYRGFHQFMRALPAILESGCHVFVIGADGASYGSQPSSGSWRELLAKEITPKMSPEKWTRVHFTGQVDYETYLKVIYSSDVHVYLTYPFVLSWSLLEVMSLGCPIAASSTPPVREFIANKHTGVLFDFFNTDELVESVLRIFDNGRLKKHITENARALIAEKYDLFKHCIPLQKKWIYNLAAS